MKKEILIVALLFISVLSFAHAELPEEFQNDSVAQQIVQGGEKLTEFTESDSKKDYLLQEWSKVLETNAAGRAILAISNFLKGANPLIEKVIGIPYGISWGFFLALLIWLTIIGFVWRPLHALIGHTWLSLLAAVIFACLVGIAGIIRKTVELASFAITKWWIALIAFILAIILALIFERLGKLISHKIQAAKENAAKEKEFQNRKVLDVGAKVAKEELDSYKEGAD